MVWTKKQEISRSFWHTKLIEQSDKFDWLRCQRCLILGSGQRGLLQSLKTKLQFVIFLYYSNILGPIQKLLCELLLSKSSIIIFIQTFSHNFVCSTLMGHLPWPLLNISFLFLWFFLFLFPLFLLFFFFHLRFLGIRAATTAHYRLGCRLPLGLGTGCTRVCWASWAAGAWARSGTWSWARAVRRTRPTWRSWTAGRAVD